MLFPSKNADTIWDGWLVEKIKITKRIQCPKGSSFGTSEAGAR